ncbi:MAG: PT domain-containing protein [Dehalococcoidia bacterium]
MKERRSSSETPDEIVVDRTDLEASIAEPAIDVTRDDLYGVRGSASLEVRADELPVLPRVRSAGSNPGDYREKVRGQPPWVWAGFGSLGLLSVAAALVLLFASDGARVAGEDDSRDEPDSDVSGDVEIADDVVVVEASDAAVDGSSDGSVIRLSGVSSAADLQPGKVLVTAEGGGFIGRVQRVEQEQGELVVHTTAASLEDLFEEASFSWSEELLPSQEVRFVRAGGSGGSDGFSVPFELDLDGGLSAEGRLNLALTPDFRLKLSATGIREARFAMTLEASADLTLTAESGIRGTFEDSIAAPIFPTFTIFVGWLPVVFTPELTLNLGVEGQLTGAVSVDVELAERFTVGAECDDGCRSWSPIYEHSSDPRLGEPRLSGAGRVHAYVGADLGVKIYQFAGPYFGAETDVSLDLEDRPPICWEATAGATASVGVRGEILGKTLADYSAPVWSGDDVPLGDDCFEAAPDPSSTPAPQPTEEPTSAPTAEPTRAPTPAPTTEPTPEPTPVPTQPPTDSVSVTVDRGEGATYQVDDSITICYTVSRPMQIDIVDISADGSTKTLLSGMDDGQGDCFSGVVAPPIGLEEIVIYGENGAQDSTYFYVEGPSGSPPNAPTGAYIEWSESAECGYCPKFYWTDNSDNEDGFEVSDNLTSFTVGPNQDDLGFVGIEFHGDDYECFHVRAYNAYGYSAWTEYACITWSTGTVGGGARSIAAGTPGDGESIGNVGGRVVHGRRRAR